MNDRQRFLSVLHYQSYDRLPLVHFGFWRETLEKWVEEGHLAPRLAKKWGDGNPADREISQMLGFDFNYSSCVGSNVGLDPAFEEKTVKKLADGSLHVMNRNGVIELHFPDVVSIPAEIEHTLVDRRSWDEQYRWRMQWSESRVTASQVKVTPSTFLPWTEGGLEFLRRDERDFPLGFFAGSLYGRFRDMAGVVGASYMQLDDPELFGEILATLSDLCYRNLEYALNQGAKFDFIHMWEDICFKNGPLIDPEVFATYCGPGYRRIADLAKAHGIDLVSVDCDGQIDALLPVWLANGVNVMFPIEVGTWDAEIAPWRQKYGKELRGVGGMNKVVFSKDHDAVDAEIERLKPLVALGGYIPCPDHRIAPDARWELVQYYCRRMREVFG